MPQFPDPGTAQNLPSPCRANISCGWLKRKVHRQGGARIRGATRPCGPLSWIRAAPRLKGFLGESPPPTSAPTRPLASKLPGLPLKRRGSAQSLNFAPRVLVLQVRGAAPRRGRIAPTRAVPSSLRHEVVEVDEAPPRWCYHAGW
jgi:hypothetical protein